MAHNWLPHTSLQEAQGKNSNQVSHRESWGNPFYYSFCPPSRVGEHPGIERVRKSAYGIRALTGREEHYYLSGGAVARKATWISQEACPGRRARDVGVDCWVSFTHFRSPSMKYSASFNQRGISTSINKPVALGSTTAGRSSKTAFGRVGW
jgi:hypothetical protein